MRAKEFGKANDAINRQLKDHDDPKLRAYLIQNYYQSGNLSGAENELNNMQKGGRTLSEDLTDYLADHGVRVRYLHSDIDTVERVEIT